MAFSPLIDRLGRLPLVLSGPMLRRAERERVTVFVAMRELCTVTLRIYSGGAVQLEGRARAIGLGPRLFVAAVTATKAAGGSDLQWGLSYEYNLFFAEGPSRDLFQPGVVVPTTQTADEARALLCYPDNGAKLPSFRLPPENVGELRILHGSCRKAGGPGPDVLRLADGLIRDSIQAPDKRPQQLYLTGDQVYADDVPDALLMLLTDASVALIGTEKLATGERLRSHVHPTVEAHIAPGGRLNFVRLWAGFTSTYAKSHLIGLGEFYAQYLMAWSGVLWPAALPTFEEVYRTPAAATTAFHTSSLKTAREKFDEETAQLSAFGSGLVEVRRALANIPTYMMLDDHEVTDDWYIFRDWCDRAVGRALGVQVLQNGLAAFAIFQAWGNTPTRFESGSGKAVLDLLDGFDTGPKSEDREALRPLVGPPSTQSLKDANAVTHPPGMLDWHYSVRGANFEVLVLDTRTWRSFNQGRERAAEMLSAAGFDAQLPLGGADSPPGADGVTIVVAPGPILDIDIAELGKETIARLIPLDSVRHHFDVENWRHSRHAYETFFARAFQRRPRIVVLSGDVHYGFSIRMGYWANHPYGEKDPKVVRGVAAQLCSSALRNGWQRKASVGGHAASLLTGPFVHHAGWNGAVSTLRGSGGGQELVADRVEEVPAMVSRADIKLVTSQPDWRYRLDFLVAETDRPPPEALSPPPAWLASLAFPAYLLAMKRYLKLVRHAAGRETVGENNLGYVTFDWTKHTVKHELFWQAPEDAAPRVNSTYVISLDPEPWPPPLSVPPP